MKPSVIVLKTVLVVIGAAVLSGCLRLSRGEMRMRSQMLKEKGFKGATQDEIDCRPETGFGLGTFEQEMRGDKYHFPELAVPEKDRKYDIKMTTE